MSKTNVKVISSPEYIVNREKGVIICKMVVELDYYPAMKSSTYRRLNKKFYDWNCRKTFTAVAKHHKSDVWNEVLGKRIDESKCKMKIYKYYSRVMLAIANELRMIMDTYNYYEINLAYAYKRENNHLKDLMG